MGYPTERRTAVGIGRCPGCNRTIRAAGYVERLGRNRWTDIQGYCYDCGRHIYLREIKGRYDPEKVCDHRCLAARGHVCVCECGGENHGVAHLQAGPSEATA